ncbi:MAG TPA: hypothetical protein VEF89_25660 [Solirubrobacteraceae bacterium]|nr:hypothetical protein [Solirubrobacteraceae bacterium]
MQKTAVMRVAMALALTGLVSAGLPGVASASGGPALGRNVIVFNPTMPQSVIQTDLNNIAVQQVPASGQFSTRRYAIFFEPGTYGSSTDPLIFQVGYYTQVAGLGESPGDVAINGEIDVFNQCSAGACNGLDNFWRSLSDLTLNFVTPSSPPTYVPSNGEAASCQDTNEMWAVSQAAPMRRVIVNGGVTLFDYCLAAAGVGRPDRIVLDRRHEYAVAPARVGVEERLLLGYRARG